jgi:hypothetical protein
VEAAGGGGRARRMPSIRRLRQQQVGGWTGDWVGGWVGHAAMGHAGTAVWGMVWWQSGAAPAGQGLQPCMRYPLSQLLPLWLPSIPAPAFLLPSLCLSACLPCPACSQQEGQAEGGSPVRRAAAAGRGPHDLRRPRHHAR